MVRVFYYWLLLCPLLQLGVGSNELVRISSSGIAAGTIPSYFFSLTADSSRFTQDAANSTIAACRSSSLRQMLRGLSPLIIRVGGTYTDMEAFPTGPAPGAPNVTQHLFSMDAWRAIWDLVQQLEDSRLVGSVSGLYRHWDQPGAPWDGTNAQSFLRFNKQHGIRIFGYELGNEPGCWPHHGGAVSPAEHARDFDVLGQMLEALYPDPSERPLVIGPDTTGCGVNQILKQYLEANPSWAVTTVHLYGNLPTANASSFLQAAQGNHLCAAAARQRQFFENST